MVYPQSSSSWMTDTLLSPYELILLPTKIGAALDTAHCLVAAAEPFKLCHLPVPQMWAQPGPVPSLMPLPSWLCSNVWERILALPIRVHSVPLHLGILWHLMWHLLLWLSHSESERQDNPHTHTHTQTLSCRALYKTQTFCRRPRVWLFLLCKTLSLVFCFCFYFISILRKPEKCFLLGGFSICASVSQSWPIAITCSFPWASHTGKTGWWEV